jgi:hypothetical protein
MRFEALEPPDEAGNLVPTREGLAHQYSRYSSRIGSPGGHQPSVFALRARLNQVDSYRAHQEFPTKLLPGQLAVLPN